MSSKSHCGDPISTDSTVLLVLQEIAGTEWSGILFAGTYPWDCRNIKKKSGRKGMEGKEFEEFSGMGGPELKDPTKECNLW
jgi:hypothetical protein